MSNADMHLALTVYGT